MPLLNITESKKVTAIVTIEENTARQVDQYAAMTKGTADEVVQQALAYVFSKDKEFETYCRDHNDAKPKIALRLKKPAATTPAPVESRNGTKGHQPAAR